MEKLDDTLLNIEQPKDGNSEIQKFFNGLNVFVTGGTGFMGKILLEKLLRSTDVSTIFILVRNKKGKDVHRRLDELFDEIIFERLRQEVPKFRHKTVGVSGDCSVAGLGLSIDARQQLISKVDVVFHCAATVRFDEKLKLAFTINVSGTKSVLDLCRQMDHVKSVVHVSTAYSNCHLDLIEEKVYEHPTNYQEVEQLLEKLNDKETDDITPRIIDNWPNTYTFTKALAEGCIRDNAKGIPLAIFRPAVVTSTYKEPVPGWIDNLYGPTGYCAGALSTLQRTALCDKYRIANVVPVDTCVSAIIAVAWDTGVSISERLPENVPVFNYVSSVENPIRWDEFILLCKNYTERYPFSSSTWKICFQLTDNRTAYTIYRVMFHYIPAILFDSMIVLCGKSPKFYKMYRKIDKYVNAIAPFCTKDWEFTNKNTVTLWNRLNRADQELFPFSVRTIPWLLYFRTYVKGVRTYLLKDAPSTLIAARKRQERFALLHTVLKYILGILLIQMLCNVILSPFRYL